MTNLSKLSPDRIARIKKFQRTFIKYFPWFEDIEEAASEWSWLQSHWVLNPIETVRHKQAEDELDRVVRALRLLATCSVPYWGQTWGAHLRSGSQEAKEQCADQVTQDCALIVEMLVDLGSMHEDGSLETVLTRLQGEARKALSYVPDTGSIKWDAVFAVDALRVVWWRNTDREAPAKALNPASEFAAFLQDGFNYLGVTANPVAAFRRWVAWKSWTNRVEAASGEDHSTIDRT